MSRKRKKPVPTAAPKQEQKLVIDMMKVERAKANHSVSFRTGRHLTEKDRPRKKDWKREYESGKESGTSHRDRPDLFYVMRYFFNDFIAFMCHIYFKADYR